MNSLVACSRSTLAAAATKYEMRDGKPVLGRFAIIRRVSLAALPGWDSLQSAARLPKSEARGATVLLTVAHIPSRTGTARHKSLKVHLADSCLACHPLGIDSAADLAKSPFLGAPFEAFIAAEIRGQGRASRTLLSTPLTVR